MSQHEKVTFRELIDSIAEETDNTKQFTHDFLKDLVSIIHEGLEEDGKVNIAGFGKFALKEVNERDGVNPRTGEKIRIPAHNKVNFTPYKSLRKRVNAPYAHLEAQLIEETEPGSPGKTGAADREDSSQASPTGESDTGNDESIVRFDDSAASATAGTAGDTEDRERFATDNDKTRDLRSGSSGPAGGAPAEEKESATTDPAAGDGGGFKWIMAAVALLIVTLLGGWLIFNSGDGSQNSESVASMAVPQNEIPAQPQVDSENPATDGNTGSDSGVGDNSPTPSGTAADATSEGSASGSASDGSPDRQEGEQQAQPSDTEAVSIEDGETLWSLAESRYEDGYLWPWIYIANRSSLGNPDLVIAGQSLSLPVPDLPDNRLSSDDSLEVARGYVESYRWHREHAPDNAKYYLWAAKTYHSQIFDNLSQPVDKEDLAFANRVR